MICPFPAVAEQAELQLPAGSQDRKTGLDGRVNQRLGRSLHYSRAGDVCIGILVKQEGFCSAWFKGSEHSRSLWPGVLGRRQRWQRWVQ